MIQEIHHSGITYSFHLISLDDIMTSLTLRFLNALPFPLLKKSIKALLVTACNCTRSKIATWKYCYTGPHAKALLITKGHFSRWNHPFSPLSLINNVILPVCRYFKMYPKFYMKFWDALFLPFFLIIKKCVCFLNHIKNIRFICLALCDFLFPSWCTLTFRK